MTERECKHVSETLVDADYEENNPQQVDHLPPASAPWSWDCYTNQLSWPGPWLHFHTMTHTTAIVEVGRILALGAGHSSVNPEFR